MTEIEPARVALPRRRDRNPYWVYLARFTGESERTMRRCLDRIAGLILQVPAPPPPHLGELVPWEQLRYPHVVKLRAAVDEFSDSASHANKHISALRGVLKECWRLELMTAEDYQRAIDVENVKGSREPAGRSIHSDEFAALLAACLADENVPLGIRDAALVAVLQSTGLRRKEAAAARIERYDPGERALRIIGKGNKERTVYIHPAAVPYLDRWLVAVGQRRGPFFRHVDRWGNILAVQLSPQTIGAIVSGRRVSAGLPLLSTHDFRRTFIGDLLDTGSDLVRAQQLAGHASPETTAGYDRRDKRELRTAVDRLSLPEPS